MLFERTIESSPLCKLKSPRSKLYARGTNTIIYAQGYVENEKYKTRLFIFSNDPSKFLYYEYAKLNNYKYVPRIINLVRDAKNGIYFIERDALNKIKDFKKQVKLQRIENILRDQRRIGLDPIADELLKFWYDRSVDENIDFDFSPDWLMQTANGKIVVSDAFRRAK